MSSSVTTRGPVLAGPRWRDLAAAHAAAVDERVSAHLQRRRNRDKHPVEDFMFTYYRLRPAALRRWHPGPDVRLADARERATWRWYRATGDTPDDTWEVDPAALLADRGAAIRLIRDTLAGTLSRKASFGCFGLHEWAMVYRLPAGAQRHEDYPLRLGPAGTDAVVESQRITCTHFDAFRFFTEPARPLNSVQPTRAAAPGLEQPGCLHATMDLYKHAYSLGPATPGDVLLACFDLAREVRELDMRASPYDLADLGYQPIRIETPDGRARYARRQRELSERAEPLRRRLLDLCDRLLRAN